MKRTANVFGLMICFVLIGFVISGCGLHFDIHAFVLTNPYPLEFMATDVDSPTFEGKTLTFSAEVYAESSMAPTVEAVIAVFKPTSFSIKNDTILVGTSNSPTLKPILMKVTSGAAVDGTTVMKRKFFALHSDIATFEGNGYEWWVGVTNTAQTIATDDILYAIATVEPGCVGDFFLYVFEGGSSILDPSRYKGTGKAYIIDSSTDTVLGSSLVGNTLFGVGLGGDMSPTSGKAFISSGLNFSPIDAHWGEVGGTDNITFINNNGEYDKMVVIPTAEEVDGIAAAGDRVYAACFGADKLRIYDESGTEQLYSPYSVSPYGVAGNQAGITASLEGSTSIVYAVSRDGKTLLVISDDGVSPSLSAIPLPLTASMVKILGNGWVAVAGKNQVALYDESNSFISLLTPEATDSSCNPLVAVDEPDRGMLYMGQNINNASGNHIWQINYGAAEPTVEAVISIGSPTGYPYGPFCIDAGQHRLYVPVAQTGGNNTGVIYIIDTVTRNINSFPTQGTPICSTFVSGTPNGKLYVSDLGNIDSSNIFSIMGPEKIGNLVKVYEPNGALNLRHLRDIEVGNVPSSLLSRNGKVLVVCSHMPAMFFDYASKFITFTATATPEILNPFINGGHVVDGDTISSNPRLTATLSDNSGISSARVIVNGWDVTSIVSFEPTLPANRQSKLSVQANDLPAGSRYSATIEVSDGYYSATWQVFDLIVTSGESISIKSGYPSVYPSPFKPLSGATPTDRTLRIAYELTIDAPVKIVVVDMTGRAVFTRKYSSGTMGGRAGYNQVEWDGRNDTGGVVGNGIYPYKLISGKKIIGSGKIVVYD